MFWYFSTNNLKFLMHYDGICSVFIVLTLLLYYIKCFLQNHVIINNFLYGTSKNIISLWLQWPKKSFDSQFPGILCCCAGFL